MPGKTYRGTDAEIIREWGFNEAPAKCRGKRRTPFKWIPIPHCFNEAPAKCRGKPITEGREIMAAVLLQ